MKFGHELSALQQSDDCPPEWRGRFLNYKQLKKAIKRIAAQDAAAHGGNLEEEERFLTLLSAEVAAVNRTFRQQAQQLVHSAARKRRTRRDCCLLGCCPTMRGLSEEDQLKNAMRAQWCRRYATVNATALRKVTKKHDKYARNTAGQQFLQACWDCRNQDMGAFLHSPLMNELRALERVSEAHRSDATARDAANPTHMQSMDRDACMAAAAPAAAAGSAAAASTTPTQLAPAAAASTATTMRRELLADRAAASQASCMQSIQEMSPEIHPAPLGSEEGLSHSFGEAGDMAPFLWQPSATSNDKSEGNSFRCSICLAPMWKPVGLSCGHIFCAECAFHSVGINNWMRPLQDVLADVPPTAKCPNCRQRYVFHEVLELKELGAVIQSRYRSEIEERIAETAAKLQEARTRLKQMQQQQRRSHLSELFQPFAAGL